MGTVQRLIAVWLFLSVITVISWQLGSDHEGQPFQQNLAITIVVIVVALVKVAFIIREFMEVRHSPNWIKWVSNVWLVMIFVVLLSIYYFTGAR